MEGFEKAGGKVVHVEYVRHMFERQMERVQEVKVSVVVLRDVVGRYRELSVEWFGESAWIRRD